MKNFKILKYFVLLIFCCISIKSYGQNSLIGTTESIYNKIKIPQNNIVIKASNEHIETIRNSFRIYHIQMDGTLDAFNTVYYPETYGKSHREASRFEPNKYVIIENKGNVDILNPRIVVNGRRNWFSADDIFSGILRNDMTDAEKAMAIFKFSSSHEVQCHENNRRIGPFFPDDGYQPNDAAIRYEKKDYTRYDKSNPSRNDFKERANPVKAANCYYCSGCQYSAANFVVLCRHAGLAARAMWMCPMDKYEIHCVAEVWYEGDWHLFDPERRSFYLNKDNMTLASYWEIHNNPSLAARTHDCGFASSGKDTHAPEYEKYYPPSVLPVEKDWLSTITMTLRPGEKFIWRWDNVAKFRIGDNPRNKGYQPYRLANGNMIYQPDLMNTVSRKGMLSELNIKTVYEDGGTPSVHTDIPNEISFVIYKVKSAYPVVGGIIGGKFYRKTKDDSCRLYVSIGNRDWVQVWSADETGNFEHYVPIDDIINPGPNPARYEYYIKYEFQSNNSSTDVGIDDIYIESYVQMSNAGLPSLSIGKNDIVYKDDTKNPHAVRITHGWQENAENKPPLPPAGPLTPTDSAGIKLNSLQRLKWEGAIDPDRQEVVDYHIQVSPRPDMLYPVSPNFDRILFSGKPEWDLPQGWLIPGKTYYWRVRANDKWGAWSQWSRVWSFTVQ
jgi:Transglutaminase-like superfamily